MSGGFEVIIDSLRTYSRTLGDDKASATEFGNMVQQSDVGDESWGIVGLFVKQKYTDMLTDLQGLMVEMGAGLEAASEKFSKAADAYQQNEDDNQKALDEIMNVLDNPAASRTPTIGPAR